MNQKIEKEIEFCNNPDFKVGEYLYMAMAIIEKNPYCIGVGYKIDYVIKRANLLLEAMELQLPGSTEELFIESHPFTKKLEHNCFYINKVRLPDLEPSDKFFLVEDYFEMFFKLKNKKSETEDSIVLKGPLSQILKEYLNYKSKEEFSISFVNPSDKELLESCK